jgi:hypothetical protein
VSRDTTLADAAAVASDRRTNRSRGIASPGTETRDVNARAWDAGRLLTLLAAAVLLVRVSAAWPQAADSSSAAALALTAIGALLLLVMVLAFALRGGAAHAILDGALVVLGLVAVGVEQRAVLFTTRHVYPSDEGRLGQYAINALLHGHDPYSLRWPDVARFGGNTMLLGGGGVTRFGYPPLGTELGALLGWVWRPLGTPGVVGALGFAATAVVCFCVLPRSWRAASVVVVLGVGPLTIYAVNGHPAMLALPLVCAACVRWTRIGAGGVLGRQGVLRAVCLGLAAGAQQLGWFLALGLLVAVWLVRRGDLGRRAAAVVTARFALVAAAAFVAVNLPFAVAGARSWFGALI